MILSDGMIGQMMEKVELKEQKPRWTDEEIKKMHDKWATIGKTPDRERNIITSLNLDSAIQENIITNFRLNSENGSRRGEIRIV